MAKVNIYLTFDGNCEQAFNFYRTVFGVDFDGIWRYKDMPDSGYPIPEELKEKVMHVGLPVNASTSLYGSDSFSAACDGEPLVIGNNAAICLNTESEEESRCLFEALSQGGTVKMPLEPTFWAALYGVVRDQFGTEWMVNYEAEQTA